MIKETILLAQRGNQLAMLQLIEKFTPLLSKYTYRLHHEDALNDLTLEFIELIHKISVDKLSNASDGALINYIAVSVRHSYISLLKKILSNSGVDDSCSWETLSDAQQSESNRSYDELGDYQQFLDLLYTYPDLTPKERELLLWVFYYEYSSAEIAQKFSQSRQNINQIKLRAIKKIRKYFNKI